MYCFESCHLCLKISLLHLQVSLETSRAIFGMLSSKKTAIPLFRVKHQISPELSDRDVADSLTHCMAYAGKRLPSLSWRAHRSNGNW